MISMHSATASTHATGRTEAARRRAPGRAEAAGATWAGKAEAPRSPIAHRLELFALLFRQQLAPVEILPSDVAHLIGRHLLDPLDVPVAEMRIPGTHVVRRQ